MSASRRQFLKLSGLAGAGLVVHVPFLTAAAPATVSATPFAPSQWLRVGSDGRVMLVVARTEMGQGVRTALSMILADELEADWASVSVEQASTGPLYTDMNTGGSGSVEDSWMPLRRAAAAARTMLVAAAAQSWNVGIETCRAESGSVVHRPTGRRLSYGRLAMAAARLPVPKDPALKDPKDFRIVGKPARRVDGPAIVTGKARYGLDTRVPGMFFAAVARCPVAGGRLRRFDAAKARSVPGVVQVVEVSTGVAVVARDTWSALSGRDALDVVWDEGKNVPKRRDHLRVSLLIGGAGPDALPLARLGVLLGWSVHVVAPRPTEAAHKRFAGVLPERLQAPTDLGRLANRPGAAAVVMTHNFLDDLDLLGRLAPLPLVYLGVLGPRERTRRLEAKLHKDGIGLSSLSLHAPAGLDIGADSQEEISLAIAAEIQSFVAGRRAGFLRDRPGPIHAATGKPGRMTLART